MSAAVYDAGALIRRRAQRPRLLGRSSSPTGTGLCPHSPRSCRRQHQVGRILGRAGATDIVDGAVVIEAITRAASIVTSDRHDIAVLLRTAGSDLAIIDV